MQEEREAEKTCEAGRRNPESNSIKRENQKICHDLIWVPDLGPMSVKRHSAWARLAFVNVPSARKISQMRVPAVPEPAEDPVPGAFDPEAVRADERGENPPFHRAAHSTAAYTSMPTASVWV